MNLRNNCRYRLASFTRRLPTIRGLGRCVLACDRFLTDEQNAASYETVAMVNGKNRLILDLRTWEQKFAFYYGTYEPELIAMTKRIFSGGVFYDVGASIGLYAITMANVCREHGGLVRAFEPVPQNNLRLEAQLVENAALQDLVQIEKIALSNEPGAAMMDLCDAGKPGNAKITSSGDVSVEVTTMDAIWEKRHHEHVDFVKIDTEGWDANIIAGGKETIRKCRPNLLVEFNRERMTNHGIAMQPAWDFLIDEMKYHVIYVDKSGTVSKVTEPGELENLFFVREEIAAGL